MFDIEFFPGTFNSWMEFACLPQSYDCSSKPEKEAVQTKVDSTTEGVPRPDPRGVCLGANL